MKKNNELLNEKAFMENPLYQEMLDEIELHQPNFYGLDQAVYSAMELLKDRKMIDIAIIIEQLKDRLVLFIEYDIFEELRNQAKELIKKEPDKTALFFEKEYDEEPFDHSSFKIEEFSNYLGVPNYQDEWYEDYELLDALLAQHRDIDLANLSNPQHYELYAILTLSYIKSALQFNNQDKQTENYYRLKSIVERTDLDTFLCYRKERSIREIISAFICLDKAKSLKYKLEEGEIRKKP